MIIKPINNFEGKTVNADFEVWHTVSSGHSTIIPIGEKWNSVAVQVSGGLDSAVLLYLTAKTIQELGLKIKVRPVSIEVLSKAKTLSSARNVVKKVAELLNFDQWDPHVQVELPLDQCKPPHKDLFFANLIQEIIDRNESQFELNGNTLNPPIEVRKYFKNDEFRQVRRDTRGSIYNFNRMTNIATSASPHSFMNKKDTVELYVKHNIIDKLSPLTLSCDENLETIQKENLSVPCKKCWWCNERAWGFTSNGFPIEKSYEYTK